MMSLLCLIQEYFASVYDYHSFIVEAGKLVTSKYTSGMQNKLASVRYTKIMKCILH